jgi:hypothetical protein
MRLGKYPDRDEKLATSAFAVPAKAGIDASAASNFSSDCSALPAVTGSCGGNNGPRHFAGEDQGVGCRMILAQPRMLKPILRISTLNHVIGSEHYWCRLNNQRVSFAADSLQVQQSEIFDLIYDCG